MFGQLFNLKNQKDRDPSGEPAPGSSPAVNQPPPTGYIFELLTSPGPRKSHTEYGSAVMRELGEDAAGLLNVPGYSFFWLADGTSDESILQGFSARILAQDAGTCLAGAFAAAFESGQPLHFEGLVNQGLKELSGMWQERFSSRWAALQTAGETASYLRFFARCGDGSLQVSWSTTFLAGLLNHDTGRLEILNLGDSGCLVQPGNDAPQATAMGSDRLFMLAQVPPGSSDMPAIALNPGSVELSRIQVFEDVQALLCLTDGNSTVNVKKLLGDHGPRGVLGLAALLKQTRSQSYDDRTIILARRIGPSVVIQPQANAAPQTDPS